MTDSSSRRSGRAKWIIGSAILLFVLLGGLSALAYALADPARLQAEMSARLGREVRFAKLSPGLFAIGVENLEVGDTVSFDPDPLLTARNLNLRYSIFSLLTGRLLVNRIDLEDFTIAVEIDTEGRSNVADLLAPRPEGPLFDLQGLNLSSGRVTLARGGEKYAVTDIAAELSNLNAAPYFVNGSFRFLEAPVQLSGSFDAGTYATRMRIGTSGLPLDLLPVPATIMSANGLKLDLEAEVGYSGDSGFFDGVGKIPGLAAVEGKIEAEWSQVVKGRGRLAVTANAQGLRRVIPLKAKLDELEAEGDLRVVVSIDGPLDAIPTSVDGELLGFSVKPTGFTSRLADLRGAFSLSPSLLTLKGMNLTAAGSPLHVSGTIGLPSIALDLALAGDRVDLKSLSNLIDPSPLPAHLALSGPARIDLKLKGAPPSVAATGRVDLLGATLNLADPKTELSAIQGPVLLAGDEIRLDQVTCRLGNSSISASGVIDRKKESLDVDLKADRLTLADLPVSLGSDRLKLDGTASFHGKVSGSMMAPGVSGRLTADRATLFNVPVTDISGQIVYDGEQLQLENLNALTLDGQITGKAAVTMAGSRMPFSLDLNVGDVSLPKTIKTVAASDALTGGIAKGHLTLSGDGTNLGTYSGRGSFTAEGIVIPALPFLRSLAPLLGVSTGSLENFSGGTLAFTISGGKLLLTRTMSLTNQHVDLRIGGGLGLDGSIDGLTLSAGIRDGILPAQVGGIPLAGALDLKKENGRTYIPVNCRGTLTAPSFSPAFNVGNVVGNVLRERFGVDLGPLVGGAPGAPPSPPTEAPAEEDKTKPTAPAPPPPDTASGRVPPNPVDLFRDILNRRR